MDISEDAAALITAGGGDDVAKTLQVAGRGNHSWMQQDSRSLRRPHGGSYNQHAGPVGASFKNTQQTEFEQTSDTEKRSVLSPAAPEFFPKHNKPPAQAPAPKSFVQERLRVARQIPSNVHMVQARTEAPIVDRAQDRYNKSQNSDITNYRSGKMDKSKIQQSHLDSSKEEASSFSLEQYLLHIIGTLTFNPAEFTIIVPEFVSTFRSDPGNLRCVQQIVTTVIEWSIVESNFRYNGARFCTYFDTAADPDEQALFRDVLYYTCKLETRIQALEWQRCEECTDSLQTRCHGLILFLAELVAQMDEAFAFALGAILIQLIVDVLKKPASNSVKYICQALKLAGRILEKDKSKSKEMENMMRALTETVTKKKVDTRVKDMVHSVHELRNDDWGRSTSNYDLSLKQPQQPQQSVDEPIMYGPNGHIIFSAEESQFLRDHVLDLNDPGILEDTDVDDDYDEEIADAYEEFLKDKPNS